MDKRGIALYVRSGTGKKTEQMKDCETQKKMLEKYAKRYRRPYKIYQDVGLSAIDNSRPSFLRLLEDIKKDKVGTIIVTRLDRITRNSKNLFGLLELFEKHNVCLRTITQPIDTSTSMGKAFIHMLGAINEVECAIRSERRRSSKV